LLLFRLLPPINIFASFECLSFFAEIRRIAHVAFRGGHWGILETAKPKKKSSKPDLKLIRMNNFTAEVTNHIQGKRVNLETFNITVINILYH